VIIYAVVNDALSPDFPHGVELVVFIRRRGHLALTIDRGMHYET
jgi:hypothetical protein